MTERLVVMMAVVFLAGVFSGLVLADAIERWQYLRRGGKND